MSRKFFIAYTLSWFILIILIVSFDHIESTKNSFILKGIITLILMAPPLWIAFKHIPKVEAKNISKSKGVLIIIIIQLVHFFLDGMIPDGMLPHPKIAGAVLGYVYSVIVIWILIRTVE